MAERYYVKGLKLNIVARVQTGNYKNKDGQTVYTTDFVIEEAEFAESKGTNTPSGDSEDSQTTPPPVDDDGFMNIPDEIDEEGLPFN